MNDEDGPNYDSLELILKIVTDLDKKQLGEKFDLISDKFKEVFERMKKEESSSEEESSDSESSSSSEEVIETVADYEKVY